MKIQQLFVPVISGTRRSRDYSSREYKRSRDFRTSFVCTFLLARTAECNMFFGKGRQISFGPPRKYVTTVLFVGKLGCAPCQQFSLTSPLVFVCRCTNDFSVLKQFRVLVYYTCEFITCFQMLSKTHRVRHKLCLRRELFKSCDRLLFHKSHDCKERSY